MKVEETPRFREEADRAYLWLVMHRPLGRAWAWEAALKAALAKLDDDPGRHPLCTDPAVQGRGLRQVAFGPGRRSTHRLVFTVDGDTLTLRTVRGLGQDDLTPEDL